MAQFNTDGKLIIKIGMWEHAPFMRQVENCMNSLNKLLLGKETPVEYKLVTLSPGDKTKKRIDILFLDGGEDVNPIRYGEENVFSSFSAERDAIEFELLRKYFGHVKISGVCRGLQVINVFFGGNLYQDITKQLYPGHHSPHQVSVASRDCKNLTNFVGLESFFVSSYHHQGIKRLADNLMITLVSNDSPDPEKLFVIEGIEGGDNREIRAVQSHPEFGELPMDGALFSYLCFLDNAIYRVKNKEALFADEAAKIKIRADYNGTTSSTSTGVYNNG